MKKAVEQGHAESARDIALFLCNDQSDMRKGFLKAAKMGDAYSQTLVGGCYFDGSLGFPKHPVEAFKWFLKAAEQGSIKAQYNCGVMYDEGEGTEKDERRALYWYEKAAEQGVPQAQYACGDMYSNGKGTEKDKARALYWYEKAAEQGHANSQYSCGVCYYNGDGVAEDLAKARTWFSKAAQQTEDQEVQEKAKKVLRELF